LPVVIPQQFHVAHIGHLTIYCRWPRNQTFIFSAFIVNAGICLTAQAANKALTFCESVERLHTMHGQCVKWFE